MMRVNVSEDLRRHIINTMVNYVGDGGDIIKDTTIDASGGIYTNIVIKTNKNKNKKSGCFKCFGF
jgi:type V secretory pathway adhesin AidA